MKNFKYFALLLLAYLIHPFAILAIVSQDKIEKIADIPYNRDVVVGNLQKMHMEGNNLVVCTNNGLYSIALEQPGTPVPCGFNGLPIADYVRKGSTMIARKGNLFVNDKRENRPPFAYISYNNGESWVEYNPEHLKSNIYHGDYWNYIMALAQNPDNTDELIMLNSSDGLWKSTDFGVNWHHISEISVGNDIACFMEYFPHDTNTFMFHGENGLLQDEIHITRDGGNTWQITKGIYSNADNCVHQMAFHPLDPNIWVFGGEGCIGFSEDGGRTFKIVWDVWSDRENVAYYYNILYDTNNPDIAFAFGEASRTQEEPCMRIAASNDKGRTWTKIAEIPIANNDTYNAQTDMIQTEDYLYLSTPDSKIYRVKKDDLMQGTSSVNDVFIEEEPSKCIDTQMYDLFGRKITSPVNGIYIQNGRKVIIR